MRYLLPLCIVLSACQPGSAISPQAEFGVKLGQLCGQSFSGKVVSDDPEDAAWRAEALTLGPVECVGRVMTLPLAVGEDRSRVWMITTSDGQLDSKEEITLSHAHTLEDGSPDPVTGYGGTTINDGSATRQDFPADTYSKALFRDHGLNASLHNVWSLEFTPENRLAYELNRDGRHFRAEFELKTPN